MTCRYALICCQSNIILLLLKYRPTANVGQSGQGTPVSWRHNFGRCSLRTPPWILQLPSGVSRHIQTVFGLSYFSSLEEHGEKYGPRIRYAPCRIHSSSHFRSEDSWCQHLPQGIGNTQPTSHTSCHRVSEHKSPEAASSRVKSLTDNSCLNNIYHRGPREQAGT